MQIRRTKDFVGERRMPTARGWRNAAALALLLSAITAGTAWSQGSEPRLLIPTPGGGVPEAPSVPPPPPGIPGTAGVPGANPAVARLEVRMSQLEQDLRTVTGRMEDVSFQLRKLDDRLDKLAADIEFRLGQAKGGSGGAAPGADATAPVAAGGGAVTGTPRVTPPLANGDPARPDTGTPSPAPAGQQTASLPPKSPREQYARAFAQLERRQYEESAAGFSEFLKANPDDPLADNARYWLGETYYARGQYGRSAELFLDAYEKSKTGPKAPDTLLKLGLSLAGLDKPKEACASFRELNRAFPNAPDAVKERAAQEGKRLGCN
ncbi:MAG TPA: tol-pal system protein YbgF [Rhodospirillales bacterium]|nr:tol-pal system protein YbgF [Rhodospirillales bacterium]